MKKRNIFGEITSKFETNWKRLRLAQNVTSNLSSILAHGKCHWTDEINLSNKTWFRSMFHKVSMKINSSAIFYFIKYAFNANGAHKWRITVLNFRDANVCWPANGCCLQRYLCRCHRPTIHRSNMQIQMGHSSLLDVQRNCNKSSDCCRSLSIAPWHRVQCANNNNNKNTHTFSFSFLRSFTIFISTIFESFFYWTPKWCNWIEFLSTSCHSSHKQLSANE